MLKAKYEHGWWDKHPQRTKSNNSAVLLRDEVSKEEFDYMLQFVENYGEPGFIWVDDLDALFNPCVEIGMYGRTREEKSGFGTCVSGDTKLITKDSIENIKDVADNKKEIEIWNGSSYKKVIPYKTDENRDLYRVAFSDGSYLDVTDNHRFLVKNRFQKKYVEMNTLEIINYIKNRGYVLSIPRSNFDPNLLEGKVLDKAYNYGFILGDGNVVSRNSTDPKLDNSISYYNPRVDIHIGSGKEYIEFEDFYFNKESNNAYDTRVLRLTFTGLDNEFAYNLKYKKGLPKELFELSYESIIDFMSGWLDADGTNTPSGGVRLYGDEFKIRDAQLLLTKIGVDSSCNVCYRKGENTIINGVYTKRNSDVYYLQITKNDMFRTQRVSCINKNTPKYKGKNQVIKSVTLLEGKHDSYCLTEPETGQCVFNNALTLQCNLVEVNGGKSNSKEIFYKQCMYASIMGTLQAGYTDFKYLKDATKEIVEDESLIGVSITGWMNNPDVLFDNETLNEGARIIKEYNEKVAAMIGINPAARTTCVKPAGNTSLLLGTASGIHGEHSKRYIRHVQLNKNTKVAKALMDTNPVLVEDSVYSDTDIVAAYPIETKPGSIYKDDLLGVKQLEYVVRAQQQWVYAGTNEERSIKHWLRHNVSNTITVDDWKEVGDFIYNNRHTLGGVSLLSSFGDKAFAQSPFTEVLSEEEILDKYGKAAYFASGLIEAGLGAFDDNLWTAISTAMGHGMKLGTSTKDLDKRDFVRRFNKFSLYFIDGEDDNGETANAYKELLHTWEDKKLEIQNIQDKLTKSLTAVNFDTGEEESRIEELKQNTEELEAAVSDLKAIENEIHDLKKDGKDNNLIMNIQQKCSECLKDVYILHKWSSIYKYYKDFDWMDYLIDEDKIDVTTLGAQACAGGACEV